MKKADEILRSFIPVLHSRESENYISLFSSWSSILGEGLEDIASHTEPVDIKTSALVVYVDHPGWFQKMEFHKKEIIRRLDNRYPQLRIRNIYVQKVSNERFIERREARLMGNTADAGKQVELKVYSHEDKNNGNSAVRPVNNVDLSSIEDRSFRETLKRFSALGKKTKRR